MKISIFIICVAASLASTAQKQNGASVPEAVKTAFSKAYPGIKVKEWEKEKNNYEAEFKVDGKEQSAVYDAQGRLVETEQEITADELPAPVRAYIADQHKGAKIKEAAKITSASGIVTYEADLGKQDLLFDAAGLFMGVEVEGKNEKDDDKD